MVGEGGVWKVEVERGEEELKDEGGGGDQKKLWEGRRKVQEKM